jgi:hypothetical protein
VIATYWSEGLQFVRTDSWDTVQLDGFDGIRGGSFNADSSQFAVGDLDSLYVIDAASGLIGQQLRLPGVSDALFIDENTLLIGTNTGIFGTVSISTEDLVAETRDSLRRSFTDQECLTYRIDPCPSLDEMRSG